MKASVRESINIFQIIAGIFSAAFGLKGFLLSTHFIDGGVTGVSMLLAHLLSYPLSVFILVINLPFIALGYRQIGKKFAIKSALAIGGLSLVLAFVPFPDVTSDKILTAVFGGFFIGAGIGLAIRGGAVLDGTEIAALLISKSSSVLRVGDAILVQNVFIFGAAAFFLGREIAMYSILTYFAASKTIDFLIHGLDEFTAIIVISAKSNLIRKRIIEELNRGVTIYKGRRGVTDTEQDIIYCVVTRLEIGRIKAVISDTDPGAFIIIQSLADVEGGLKREGALH
jgi:uncharacterized membrane-anchored protein YitT (DUF2179 family)